MAKYPLERKERMKMLKILEGEEIPEGKQGAAMEKAHFLCDKSKTTKVLEHRDQRWTSKNFWDRYTLPY